MPRHWFHPPVTVETDKVGLSIAVSNVEQASECLLSWERRGPMWRKANDACMRALAGDLDPKEVRPLFEAAAKEADRFIRG